MDTTTVHNTDEEDVDAPGLPDRLLRKAETAVLGRTSRILCVIERCTDEHNYSAVLRTAEALGVQHVWLVDPVVSQDDLLEDESNEDGTKSTGTTPGRGKKRGHGSDWREAHKLFARRAQEFMSIREFPDAKSCVAALKQDGRTIWATDLSQHAVPLTESSLREAIPGLKESESDSDKNQSIIPEKLAIVFGTESVGVTETIFAACDLRVYLPLRGFADSLNLSVAAALCMQKLFHLCPEAVGEMNENERNEIRKKWFTQLAAGRALTKSEEKRLKWIELTLGRREKGGALKPGEPSTDELKNEADALEKKRAKVAAETAAVYIQNLPKPLKDMRRADTHREAFVGRNTKAKNLGHWAGMPAVGEGGE
tara:strand:- start:15408 stop:16511 length:1104 start_codon:yes stop_codon:yes gene_type:complete